MSVVDNIVRVFCAVYGWVNDPAYGSVECCASGDHAAESISAFKVLAPAVGPAAAIRTAFGVDRIAESAGVAASAGRKWHRG